ncbi:MAG: hypothetical protein V3V48_12415 [Candidatus Aminicenantaceae bacterium]
MVQKLRKKTNRTQRIFVLVLLSLLIIGVGAQSLEARACERAFGYCMGEIIAPGNMIWFIYCANGYAFCKKYID